MTRRAFGVLASLFPGLFGKKAEAKAVPPTAPNEIAQWSPDENLRIFNVAESDREAFEDFFKKQNAITITEEPESIKQISIEQQVYIFNVSPFRFVQEMGSYGSFVIPAVAEAECLSGKIISGNFAGPLVIPGLPVEYYPIFDKENNRVGKPIFHKPYNSNVRPGMDFAREIIGANMGGFDLRKLGVFVSEHRVPLAEEIVEAASKLRATAEKELDGTANLYRLDLEAKGEYARVKAEIAELNRSITDPDMWLPNPSRPARRLFLDERLFAFARILGKTKSECPWMGDNY